MSKLTVDNNKCTGCRTCEIACSYHHKKVFNPKIASLEVQRNEVDGTMSVMLYRQLPQEIKRLRLPCDACIGEPEPFCVKYCPTGAITVKPSKRYQANERK